MKMKALFSIIGILMTSTAFADTTLYTCIDPKDPNSNINYKVSFNKDWFHNQVSLSSHNVAGNWDGEEIPNTDVKAVTPGDHGPDLREYGGLDYSTESFLR